MSRYIDADELYERMQDICAYYEEGREVKEEALSMVYHFHTADVEEIKHGEWKDCGSIWEGVDEYKVWRCSNCVIPNYKKTRYCPNCGARMDKEKEI